MHFLQKRNKQTEICRSNYIQFRALGTLILLKHSSMIARKIFLQKLLLKKVSVDIHVTRSCNLCILNISKKDKIVFPLGNEGEEMAALIFHSRYRRLQLSGVFPVDFLPLHFLALVVLTQDRFNSNNKACLMWRNGLQRVMWLM